MPTRNLSFQSSFGGSDLIKIRDLNHPEDNVFDEEFHADMDMKDWNDWMQNEAQLDSPMIDRRQSIASTVSWLEGTSSANTEQTEKPIVFSSFMNNNEFSFEDALLDFDEVPPPCYSLPVGTNSISNSSFSSSLDNRAPQEVPRRLRPMSSLTEAEERCLTDIAMPYHLTAAANKNNKRKSVSVDPGSPAYSTPAPSPSPEPVTRKSRTNKKRKSIIDDAESRNALCQSRKTGHNMIEKRYRTNLNEKIDYLRQSVPAFPRRSSTDSKSDGEEEDDDDDAEDSKIGRQKYGKAAILTRALEYIKHLENTTQRLGGEVDLLKNRVGAFEKLAMSGSLVLSDRVGLVAGGLLMVKSETLETIRADFKPVGPKYRPLPGPTTRRRNSRQVKIDGPL